MLSFRRKPYRRYHDVLCFNKQEWIQTVVLSTYYHLQLGKAALIICKDIMSAALIESEIAAFKHKHKQYEDTCVNIDLYTRDDNQEKLCLSRDVGVGDVVVATNLAGRGTDIKLEKQVIANGGLHVCITFEPSNERICWQNIGRTCRKGMPGSYGVVINRDTCQYCVDDADSNHSSLSVFCMQLERKRQSGMFMSRLACKLKEGSASQKFYSKYKRYMNELRGNAEYEKVLTDHVSAQIVYEWSVQYQAIQQFIGDEKQEEAARI